MPPPPSPSSAAMVASSYGTTPYGWLANNHWNDGGCTAADRNAKKTTSPSPWSVVHFVVTTLNKRKCLHSSTNSKHRCSKGRSAILDCCGYLLNPSHGYTTNPRMMVADSTKLDSRLTCLRVHDDPYLPVRQCGGCCICWPHPVHPPNNGRTG